MFYKDSRGEEFQRERKISMILSAPQRAELSLDMSKNIKNNLNIYQKCPEQALFEGGVLSSINT